MVTLDQESIVAVADYFGVSPHRAGQHDAASAHGFDHHHPERFLARLEIEAESAGLHTPH